MTSRINRRSNAERDCGFSSSLVVLFAYRIFSARLVPLRFYNTLSKKEEDFVPLCEGKVTMYTCGPTVYGRPHIGNYSSFLMADLLRRWLEAGHGYEVTHVKNITDVGHLSGDAVPDAEGSDKIEQQAKKEKVDPLQIAKKYTEQYLADEKALNFREPAHRPKATETIPEMIAMIESLLKKGHAYATDDGVYFSVESFPSYGKLSGNSLRSLNAGARIEVKEQKKHPADFALWKKCVGENAHHILRWHSPWGEGFPGWHIECSCMSEKFLGSPFDIHTGGEDLIFPHHECEIAQSEGSGDGTPHVRYWIHKRFIDIGSTSSPQEVQKMSKSLGNVLTLPDIEAMGFSPLDLRYYLLSVHYRTNLKFTQKGLEDAHKARRKIMEWMGEVENGKWKMENGQPDATAQAGSVVTTKSLFDAAMDHDLNTPDALSRVFEILTGSRAQKWVDGIDEDAYKKLLEFIRVIRDTFGCFDPEEVRIPDDVLLLQEKRRRAREEKNFAESDALREAIKKRGYEVRDIGAGQELRKL